MKKLFIWGTGTVAKEFVDQLNMAYVEIAGFIETSPTKGSTLMTGTQTPVYPPEVLKTAGYDYLIIAAAAFEEILDRCRKMGLGGDNILCTMKSGDQMKMDFGYGPPVLAVKRNFEELASGRNIFDHLKLAKREEEGITEEKLRLYRMDYFRYKTLELTARLIHERGIPGAVAELGVFRGDFAWAVNKCFPDRTLYLFDTFASFDDGEFSRDFARQDPADPAQQKRVDYAREKKELFANTSEQMVLAKLPHPGQAVVRKGFFPETAAGLEEERFAFVSLDVDLSEPIYNGLKFFYQRLHRGGCLFIHNYTDSVFVCVREAVERYEKEHGMLNMLPLGDAGGTLVIVK